MATYHLYYLKRGELIGSEDIEAGDDLEAARIAEARGRGDLVEIWNASSRIRILASRGAEAEAEAEALPGAAAAAVAV